MTVDKAKIAAATEAVEKIKNGYTVGLGSGTTAEKFLELLAKKKLNIQVIASSKKIEEKAITLGFKLLDENLITELDITVDGADEISEERHVIKGGGGVRDSPRVIAGIERDVYVGQ